MLYYLITNRLLDLAITELCGSPEAQNAAESEFDAIIDGINCPI
jgi:hypothetical protein